MELPLREFNILLMPKFYEFMNVMNFKILLPHPNFDHLSEICDVISCVGSAALESHPTFFYVGVLRIWFTNLF